MIKLKEKYLALFLKYHSFCALFRMETSSYYNFRDAIDAPKSIDEQNRFEFVYVKCD